jgi:N-acetylmuramic acid 6-phosphate etherase
MKALLLTSNPKLVLSMISISVMINLNRIKGNRMVNMQLSNKKLVQRGIDMIVKMGNVDATMAEELLKKHGSVREVLERLNA